MCWSLYVVRLRSCRGPNTYLLQTKTKSYNTPIMWPFDKLKIKPSVYPVFPGKVRIPQYLWKMSDDCILFDVKHRGTVVQLRSCRGPNTYLLQTKTKSYNTPIMWPFDKLKIKPSVYAVFPGKVRISRSLVKK